MMRNYISAVVHKKAGISRFSYEIPDQNSAERARFYFFRSGSAACKSALNSSGGQTGCQMLFDHHEEDHDRDRRQQ